MNLTPEQTKAITHPHSTAVIASAGTGKTTVLTQRFIHCLTSREAKLFELLAFTFTEKAAREMRERVMNQGELTIDDIPLLNISTIHAFCRSLLCAHAETLNLKPDFEILDANHHELSALVNLEKFIAQGLQENNPTLTLAVRTFGLKVVRKIMIDALPGFTYNNEQTNPTEHKLQIDLLKLANQFNANQQSKRIQAGLLCFDDLEILATRLLEQNELVRSTLQKKYKFILVDEFQDISPLEAKLIRALFNPAVNELFIVGDPKQSIYRFRGADVRLFDKTAQLIEQSGGLICHLAETFRTPVTLQNHFDKIFPVLLPETLKSPVTTNQNTPGSQFNVHTVNPVHSVQTLHQDLAKTTAKKISQLVSAGSPASEIAILFYAGTPVNQYRQLLEERGFPVVVETASTLLDDPLIVWLWHVLNYLAGARDKITQIGILRSTIVNLSEPLIKRLALSGQDDFFKKQTLDLFDTATDQASWQKICQHIDAWQKLVNNLSANDLVTTILATVKPNMTIEQELALQHFCDLLTSWQKQGLCSLVDIKDLLLGLDSLDIKHTLKDEAIGGVRLLSIHKAKGLEFDHVFLIPGNPKNNDSPHFKLHPQLGFVFKTVDPASEKQLHREFIKPTIFKELEFEEKQQHSDEIRRLLYVAMTRAKKTLTIFADEPSQEKFALLEKDPTNTTLLSTYNDWLYWVVKTFSATDTFDRTSI
jgi:ATP-dependent helicase/nuclease subunit A